MVGSGMGEILEKNGRYYLRIPKDVAEDSAFPFNVGELVDVSFKVTERMRLGKAFATRLVVKRIDP